MGWNSATGYALHRIPAHRKKRTINLLQNRTFLFTSDRTAALNLWVAKNDLKPIGTAQLARYNAPITPPPFRRNEILLTVE